MSGTEIRGELGHRLDLPPDPQSTVDARQHLRRVLAGTEVDLEAVLLVASELVTNAVTHARTSLQLILRWPPLRIEVTDLVPLSVEVAALIARPVPFPSADAPGGRGLPIAHAIATRIGADDHGPAGKTIWAEFAANVDQVVAARDRVTEVAADIALTQAHLTVTGEQAAKTRADAARIRQRSQEARRSRGGRPT